MYGQIFLMQALPIPSGPPAVALLAALTAESSSPIEKGLLINIFSFSVNLEFLTTLVLQISGPRKSSIAFSFKTGAFTSFE
jgi:hypothetical protein